MALYHIYRNWRGGSLSCKCGRVDCNLTTYAAPGDRAYRFGEEPCHPGHGHTAPVEVPLEEAQAAAFCIEHLG